MAGFVTVTARGPSIDKLSADLVRELRTANKRAGRAAKKVGVAAMKRGAPRFYGRPLAVKADVEAWPNRVAVEFHPAPRNAGPWQIAETGAGPHDITPTARKALRFAGLFSANVDHPGAGGRQAWSRAGERLAKVLDREIADVYDEALI